MLGERKELRRMDSVTSIDLLSRDEATKLRVSEMFGPTLQGEGPSQGKAVMFLRLGLCNLDCAWCDTPYTWDWAGKNGKAYDKEQELSWKTIDEITEWASNIRITNKVNRMVVTGGEPLIQQRRLGRLAEVLDQCGISIEIETNGTITPNPALKSLAQFNVSPKLASSGVAPEWAINYGTLSDFASTTNAVFKFVIADERDLSEMRTVIDRLAIDPSRVYVMPEGTMRDSILERLGWLFDKAAENGWNLSPRLHVLAFNNKRGV